MRELLVALLLVTVAGCTYAPGDGFRDGRQTVCAYAGDLEPAVGEWECIDQVECQCGGLVAIEPVCMAWYNAASGEVVATTCECGDRPGLPPYGELEECNP